MNDGVLYTIKCKRLSSDSCEFKIKKNSYEKYKKVISSEDYWLGIPDFIHSCVVDEEYFPRIFKTFRNFTTGVQDEVTERILDEEYIRCKRLGYKRI